MINGRPVRARHQMRIMLHPNNSSAEAIVFSDSAEVATEPAGGHAAFRQWICSNYHYPNEAVEQSINGTLKLRFIVEKDGSITHLEVLKDFEYGTGEVAIHVMKGAPRWKPALITGKTVRSYFIFPITVPVQ